MGLSLLWLSEKSYSSWLLLWLNCPVTHHPKSKRPNTLSSNHPVDELSRLVLSLNSMWELSGTVASRIRKAPSKGCVLVNHWRRPRLEPVSGRPDRGYDREAPHNPRASLSGGWQECPVIFSLHNIVACVLHSRKGVLHSDIQSRTFSEFSFWLLIHLTEFYIADHM